MNKFTKRAIGLLVSLSVAISMCLGATAIFAANTTNPSDKLTTYQHTTPHKAPVNGQNGNSDMFYFEILPEILLDNNNAIFKSPFDTPGNLRSPIVFGGPVKYPTAKSAWEKVAFNVYDENGNLIETKTGTIGDHGRWGGAKYIGPYKKGHNYTISVDTSTLPDGYYSYVTAVDSGHFPQDVTEVKDFKNAKYDKSFKEDYASVRFNMDVVSVLYAKNEDVAKNQFTLDDKGKATGWNTKYKNGDDYVLKTIDKYGNFVIPTKEEMEKLADEGYRPNGFYFYMIDDNGEQQKIGPLYEKLPTTFKLFRNGFNYLRYYTDNDGINTLNKYKQSGIFTMVLDQSVPKVTFDRNFDDPKYPNTEVGTLNVYYKKSLKTNCVGNSCGSKSLPKAPTRKGKVFAGWNTKPDGSGDKFTINTKVTDDVIVYAQWKDKEVNPNPNTPADTKNTPKTGDNTLDILYVLSIAMVMSTGLLLILKKRKSIK